MTPGAGNAGASKWWPTAVGGALAAAGGSATLLGAEPIPTILVVTLLLLAAGVLSTLAGLHLRRRRAVGADVPAALKSLVLVAVLTSGLTGVLVLDLAPIAVCFGLTAGLTVAALVAVGANQVSAGGDLGGWRGTTEIQGTVRWRRVLDTADAVLGFPLVKQFAAALSARPPARSASPYALLAPMALGLAVLVLFVTTAERTLKKDTEPTAMTTTTTRTEPPGGAPPPQEPPRTTTPTSVAPGTSPPSPPPLSPVPVLPAPSPCGDPSKVGAGATAGLAEQLRGLVHGSVHLARDGAGEEVTGCMGVARQVRGQPGVFVTEGRCDGRIRSFGVVSASQRAHLLLQQRAAAAHEEAEAGQLLGASATIPVGTGDLQVLDTTVGSRVLIRQRSSRGATGTTGVTGATGPCSAGSDRNAPYADLMPGAAAALRATINAIGTWVWASPAPAPAGMRRFVFITESPVEVVAEVTCRAALDCHLTIGSQRWRITRGLSLDACQLAALGPPPVRGQHPDATDPDACR